MCSVCVASRVAHEELGARPVPAFGEAHAAPKEDHASRRSEHWYGEERRVGGWYGERGWYLERERGEWYGQSGGCVVRAEWWMAEAWRGVGGWYGETGD